MSIRIHLPFIPGSPPTPGQFSDAWELRRAGVRLSLPCSVVLETRIADGTRGDQARAAGDAVEGYVRKQIKASWLSVERRYASSNQAVPYEVVVWITRDGVR